MTRQEAIEMLKKDKEQRGDCFISDALEIAIEALELEPCCNCIEFKRYAKQMGFKIEKQSIPYLIHKEMDIPISECQKAYDVAIDYLRRQGKVRG